MISLRDNIFFFFTWSSSCVKDSIENEVKDITKTQIRKGLGGILKAFGLYKWEGLRKSFWQKNTTKALYL